MSLIVKPINPDWLADQRGVFLFANAMLEKLNHKRKEGRHGWHAPAHCSIKELRAMLKEHMKKGDMVDVANYAMMIWNREQMKMDI